MRGRLYAETRIMLNNSNSKWIAIGIVPSSPSEGDVSITGFSTQVYIRWLNGQSLHVGTQNHFLKLMNGIRQIDYFRHMCKDVSHFFFLDLIY